MTEIPSVGNDVQRCENTRKKFFLNYESPALTAELQARVAIQLNHNETRMTNLESVWAEILDKACDYIACLVGIASTRHEGS
jgi:hypothetical protein